MNKLFKVLLLLYLLYNPISTFEKISSIVNVRKNLLTFIENKRIVIPETVKKLVKVKTLPFTMIFMLSDDYYDHLPNKWHDNAKDNLNELRRFIKKCPTFKSFFTAKPEDYNHTYNMISAFYDKKDLYNATLYDMKKTVAVNEEEAQFLSEFYVPIISSQFSPKSKCSDEY